MTNAEFILLAAVTAVAAFLGGAFGAVLFGRRPGLEFGYSGPGPIQWIAVTVGLALVIVGLSADVTGLSPNPGIGVKQVAMVIVGAAVLAVAPFLKRWK